MADRDRNLLFGIFAVQLKKINPSQLMEVAGAWAIDPSRDLGQRLVEAGYLSKTDEKLLMEFVKGAVDACGGDAGASLAAFGGAEEVNRSFQGSIVLTDKGVVTKPMSGVPTEQVDMVPAVQEAPGRYSQISEHGRGGMGRVLLVHDQYLGRDVALKELLLPSGSAVDPNRATPVRMSMQMMARFLQESRITGQLEHPAIVPVYEIGHRKNGTLYYTMKLVRGRTLTNAIKEAGTLQGRLALLPHFVDLCQAIAYAHSRGVIHRDIKPDNVMVGEFGETVVLDWGLAKAHNQRDVHADGLAETLRVMNLGDETEVVKTTYGHAIGTPAYMPPEQARGNLDFVTERSDVYSLGAVLYELLTGHPPFEGATLFALLNSVLNELPTPITTHEADAPPELVAICERTMQKNAPDRYASAKELAEEVKRFQSGALVQSYDYGLRDLLGRFVRKHKAILATATAAVIFLLVLGAASYLQIMRERDHAINAKEKETHAREAEVKARQEVEELQVETRRQLYRLSIMQAKAQKENGLNNSARNIISQAPQEYRNWEWGFLAKALYPSLAVLQQRQPAICPVSFSPDGRRIVAAYADGTARIWDMAAVKYPRVLLGHKDFVSSVSFSPDNRAIVTSSKDGTARVWDVATGKEVTLLEGHRDAVLSASFSPDSLRIVTASKDKTARVWDVVTGKEITVLEDHRDVVLSASFSPDNLRIVTASHDGGARIWDAESGEILARVGHTAVVSSASFSSDSSRIVTASHDKTACIWDAVTGKKISVLEGHKSIVMSAFFSPDNLRIATASHDMTARIWDAATGKEISVLTGHKSWVFSAVFSPDSKYVVTASNDKTARIWDVESGEELAVLDEHAGVVLSALFSSDGRQIVTASLDSTIRIWDSTMREEIISFKGQNTGLKAALFSPDSEYVLTISNDKTARIWDVQSGIELSVLAEHEEMVAFAVFSPNSKRIVTASGATGRGAYSTGRSAYIWDAVTGEKLAVLNGHTAEVWLARFSPDSLRIVTSSKDGTARVWDVETGKEISVLTGHKEWVTSALFSPDGKCIVTTADDKTVRIWDVTTAKELVVIDGNVWRASFSPDGTRIMTVSNTRREIRILDVTTGNELLMLEGNYTGVYSQSFSPDGTRVVACVKNAPAFIWDAVTGQLIASLIGHGDEIQSASFSPDGTRVVTSSSDMTVRIWDAETGEEMITLKGHKNWLAEPTFDRGGMRIIGVDNDGTLCIWEATPWHLEDFPEVDDVFGKRHRGDFTRVETTITLTD